MKRALLVLTLAALCAGAARAEDGAPLSGALKAISDRGVLLIGTRDSAAPFSFRNQAGQPIGFSIDLCRGVAADIAQLLHRDLLEPDAPSWQQGVRIRYVPLTPEARLPKVIAGEVHLECGSTTATAERARQVAFSPVFFLAGTKLLTAAGSAITSYRDAPRIAVSTGTTNADVMRQLAARTTPPPLVMQAPGLSEGYELVTAGQADALASDDILLAGLIATRPNGKQFKVVGDYLSYEPYAIALPRDDPAFSLLVRASFERMAKTGTLGALYRRWFTGKLPTGETMNLPMSSHLAEMYRALGEPD